MARSSILYWAQAHKMNNHTHAWVDDSEEGLTTLCSMTGIKPASTRWREPHGNICSNCKGAA